MSQFLKGHIEGQETGAGKKQTESQDKKNKIIVYTIGEQSFAGDFAVEANDEIDCNDQCGQLSPEADKEQNAGHTFDDANKLGHGSWL